MSWFSDKVQEGFRVSGGNYAAGFNAIGLGNVSDWIRREFVDKSDLRAAQTESLLSGVPFVGDMLRGVNGVQQIEDLYNQTGKTAAYPASQNLGASGVGYGLQALSRKIENGSNDLYQYYAGEPDRWTANMYN